MWYDVIIVGAGPAGLFAAYELASSGKDLAILVIDKGKDVSQRGGDSKGGATSARGDIMCGMGGAGTWSDGTLNLRPDIGGDLDMFTGDTGQSWGLVHYVDALFLKHGAPSEVCKACDGDAEELTRRAACAGVDFIEICQRHIGSDHAAQVIGRFGKTLHEFGGIRAFIKY